LPSGHVIGSNKIKNRMSEEFMSDMKNVVVRLHNKIFGYFSYLQSPFLLFIRVYWGWQFCQTGWGKLHGLAHVTEYFGSLGIPFPGLNATFIACSETFGGVLLIVGLLSRPIALLLACDMLVAFLLADREAFFSIFSHPEKLYAADPYTFLFAALIILIFGPGRFSIDWLLSMVPASKGSDVAITPVVN
jgi:putative oxidoreductase